MGSTSYSDEDLEFWMYMLTYYRHGVVVDDLEAWNEEQVNYYRKYGNYMLNGHESRRELINEVIDAIRRDKVLWKAIG